MESQPLGPGTRLLYACPAVGVPDQLPWPTVQYSAIPPGGNPWELKSAWGEYLHQGKKKIRSGFLFFFFFPFFLQRANLPASCLVIQSPESCSLSPNRSSQQGPTGPPREPGLATCRACRAPVPHAERSTHRPYPPVQSLEPNPCADPDPDRSSLSQGPLHTAAPLKQRVFSKRHGEHLHHKRIQRAQYPPGTLQCCLGQESCSRYVMKRGPGPSLQTCPSRPQLQL